MVSENCPMSVERSESFWMVSADDATEFAISSIWRAAPAMEFPPSWAMAATRFAAVEDWSANCSKFAISSDMLWISFRETLMSLPCLLVLAATLPMESATCWVAIAD